MAGITATQASPSSPEPIGIYKTERWTLTNGAPAVATAAGSGTGGTATINAAANDSSGQIVITTGTAIPGGGGTLAVVTFANTLAGTPSPMLFAAGANAAALMAGTSSPWVVATTTNFSVLAGSATVSTAYTFNYSIPDASVNVSLVTRYVRSSSAYATGENGNGASLSSISSGGTATVAMRPNFSTGAVRLWEKA